MHHNNTQPIKITISGDYYRTKDFWPEIYDYTPICKEITLNGRKFLFQNSSTVGSRTVIDFHEVVEVAPKFKIGDHVTKNIGYKFSGFIRSSFKNKEGLIRVVVEHEDGWMHIFNEGQLILSSTE